MEKHAQALLKVETCCRCDVPVKYQQCEAFPEYQVFVERSNDISHFCAAVIHSPLYTYASSANFSGLNRNKLDPIENALFSGKASFLSLFLLLYTLLWYQF